ncbi:MAG: hypothetical protein K0S44_1152 [Bacteroidetes bacterium]|nr:hypothetical protein [Bacteroidota bacterium]
MKKIWVLLNKSLKILKPINLNYETAIKKYNPKYYEKYAWLIHLILLRNFICDDTFNGFVKLQSCILKEYLGDKFYKKVVTALVDNDIIEVDSSYSPGEFSKSYRLTKIYTEYPPVWIAFSTRKAKGYFEKYKSFECSNHNKFNDPDMVNVINQNIKKINIDSSLAVEKVELLLSDGVIKSEARSSYFYFIDAISSGDLFLYHSQKTGRLYHTIVGCPRSLRGFLHVNEEKLFQVDVANCQPMIFVKMLQEYLKVMRTAVKYDRKSIGSGYLFLSYIHERTIYTPYVSSFLYPPDVNLYIELTKTGGFYEFLMRKFKVKESDRETFKKDFFARVFYSKLKGMEKYRYGKLFKLHFPTVYKAIVWGKRSGHHLLPTKMQSIESNIVIQKVCARICKEHDNSEIPFFIPAHDAIICFKEKLAYIEKIMLEEFTSNMGFTPTVRQKHF